MVQLCDLYIIPGTEGRTTPRTRRRPGLGSFSPGPSTDGMYGVMEMKTVCWTVAVTQLANTPTAITKKMLLSSVCQVMALVKLCSSVTERQTRDRKVTRLSHGKSGGNVFFLESTVCAFTSVTLSPPFFLWSLLCLFIFMFTVVSVLFYFNYFPSALHTLKSQVCMRHACM